MKLQFNGVGQLQTVVICPSCGKTGKNTMFTIFGSCCFRYALMRLGIQDRRKCPLCGENFVTDDDEIGCRPGYCRTNAVPVGEVLVNGDGMCYAHENCNEEFCKSYEPYNKLFTNGLNYECRHHGLDGRCTL